MVNGIGAIGYAMAGAAWCLFAAVVAVGWRRSRPAIMLLVASVATALWALVEVAVSAGAVTAPWAPIAGAARSAAWLGLLLLVMRACVSVAVHRALVALAVTACVVPILAGPWTQGGGLAASAPAVALLIVIHAQWWASTREALWGLRFLLLALAATAVHELLLALARGNEPSVLATDLWVALGYLYTLIVPLVAVAATRMNDWSLHLAPSRRLTLNVTVTVVAGLYVIGALALAVALGTLPGAWSRPLGILFLAIAALGLALLLTSGEWRARIRVFLSKHFYARRYDYREETLRFTRTLAAPDASPPLRRRVIEAIGAVVDSPSGVLLQVRNGAFVPTEAWNLSEPAGVQEPLDGELARFLADSGWVLVADEWRSHPERYRGVAMPDWFASIPRAWLLVPLTRGDHLEAMLVLTRSRAGRVDLDWEDCDLLRTLSLHAAIYLAREDASNALVMAQQFAAVNRLTAFVMHDLKNVLAQLSMLASNARRHRRDPAFVDDAIETLDNAVARMRQLLEQLGSGRSGGRPAVVDVARILQQAVGLRSGQRPLPNLDAEPHLPRLRVERGRLLAVIEHAVRNAQEATPGDGEIRVRAALAGTDLVIDIVDTGSGMTPQFVRDRLFRPFDTSKAGGGMGIGAFEAREFAQECGGSVEVDSEPGSGTRFRFRFPPQVLVAPSQEAGAEGASQDAEEEPDESVDAGSTAHAGRGAVR